MHINIASQVMLNVWTANLHVHKHTHTYPHVRTHIHTHIQLPAHTHAHAEISGSAFTSRCIVQCWFDSGQEYKVLIRHHGNSKKHKQSFCRMHPSTMKVLKEKTKNHPPREAVSVVYEENGGTMGTYGLGELSRNCEPVSNMRHCQLHSPHV